MRRNKGHQRTVTTRLRKRMWAVLHRDLDGKLSAVSAQPVGQVV
jgi:hypothetical protein